MYIYDFLRNNHHCRVLHPVTIDFRM